ncbi:SEC-C metal-binding domain-containing protein [Marinifilum caeruleilacunae]|uniref:SEC-C domain-containing protein n=1 Tax=Marinifilum caeruleilacunae TaxID=2499076 RepID=A0ABX1X1E4_9BACT|nr:SEC-C metal-binding domain-containing protein [Marinifilum caeruleilacunae]NOU62235.1 SEC-C domain-containing protein [Marinifilum caeruleilacunae]
MNFLRKLIRKLLSNQDSFEYKEFERNEKCYCESGKKYKQCHLPVLNKKGKLALHETNLSTGEKRVRIYSVRKYKGLSTRMKTSLRGVDVQATNVALNDHNNLQDIYRN